MKTGIQLTPEKSKLRYCSQGGLYLRAGGQKEGLGTAYIFRISSNQAACISLVPNRM